MKIQDVPFETVTWAEVLPTTHTGGQGAAHWRTRHCNEIRVRRVTYTPGYVADHWCTKGHILFCISGELTTELADGRTFTLTPGMSYQVTDDAEPHLSRSPLGSELFIVD